MSVSSLPPQRKEAQLAKFLESRKVGPITPPAEGSPSEGSTPSTSVGTPTRVESGGADQESGGTDPVATKDGPDGVDDESGSGSGPAAEGHKDKTNKDGRKDDGS